MTQAKYDVATPYTAAYLIFRDNGKLAFLLRENTSWMDGYYCLPGGKVDKGESFVAAAAREAKEEVGVLIRPSDLKAVLTAHRNAEDSLWVDVVFEVIKWTGKIRNAEPDIHKELTWLGGDNLPKNIIPATRFYLEQIQAGKTYAEYGWDT